MSSTVEQIKSRLDITDVVQSYVKLQKAGANFKANCPFHNEKTPSFFISPARQSWHCFGCSRGGDMFSFVMEIEGVDFLESLKILADKAGVEIEKIDKNRQNERLRLLQLMDEAVKFYEMELRKNTDVVAYLKKRGMKGETAKSFNVGFAPAGWRNLYDYLKNKGYSDSETEKAGMAVKSTKAQTGYYDRFRSRIMFPILNGSGQTVGFSGRIFGEEGTDSGGKYINSPQTILYDKSKVLYGFDKAKNEIRKKDACVIMEGQMDAVMSHQAGVVNAVAVSGTALTVEHLRLIKRLTEKIIMAFDKDEAGARASSKGIDMALAEGFEVKIAVSPSGKDPADAVLDNPESWIKAVSEAKNVIEFYLELFDERKDIERKILPYIAVLPSEMDKAGWVKKISEKLKIKEDAVWDELKKVKLAPKPRGGLTVTPDLAVKPPSKQTRLEFMRNNLLGMALWQKDAQNNGLKPIIDEFVALKKEEIENCPPEKKNKLALEAELFFSGAVSLKDEFLKIKKEIEKEEIKAELESMTEKIKELEMANEFEESGGAKFKKYLDDFHKLTKKLNETK
ncbi:MAG: DNA primase [Candidatus Terrybacteria bacterium RIFCSPLOWO2_02_42_20]|uniref:DNA primase n=2 Tax=Candidatus Terryibacteriota TaxID=1817920 RepID=A0A1G2PLH3_9BACT|nr:MAG: DNA primase [Candidatus Terrybacteria bacterium RIFCSPHIGHO2_02_41_19]OHA54751.1 MAG: DNA primase [Candidatus Terrybacteria bacterium RIFCSPLOWO2_02_42_20]